MDLHPAEKGIRTTITGIAINIVLAILKGVAGILGHSFALVADAIESISDVLTSTVVFIGLKVASKEPDEDHPYGHGKAEPLAATIVALALAIAAVLIIVQAIHNILTPHELPAAFTLYALIIVVVVKEILYRYVIKAGKETESHAVKADAWHHRSDAFTSAAVFIGILIARIGGEGYESADDWAALFASGIIMYNSYTILKPALAEIMDTAPHPDIVAEVRSIAAKVVGVRGVEKCFVRKMGFDFYVDIHVEVDGSLTVREGHEIAHLVKDAILESKFRINDVLVHVEPFETENNL